MHKHHQLLFRLSLVPLLAILIAPLTAGGMGASLLGQTEQFRTATQLRSVAKDYHPTYQMQHRAYTKAFDHCMKMRRSNPDAPCPDVNDLDSYRAFLPPEWQPQWEVEKGLRPAAFPQEESASGVTLTAADLSGAERVQLRQLLRLEVCPASLSGTLLYQVCLEQLGAGADTDLERVLQDLGVNPDRIGNQRAVMERLQSIHSEAQREQPSIVRPSVRRGY